jgi:hypothetical protein
MGLSAEQRKKLYDDHSMDDAHKRSYDSKDAGAYKDIFDRSQCTKYNVSFFKPAATEHLIDILPYLAGKNAPFVQGAKTLEGSPAYLVDVYVHRGVGVNEDQYICMARSYNKPCYICEQRNNTDLSTEEIEALRPKRRTVYAIWDRDAEGKGVQVWEVAHWYMEKKLQARAKRPRGGGYVNYSHPKRGKSISFSITAKGEFKEYDGHDFVDRDDEIPEEILEKVPPLDELLHLPSYEEVKVAYLCTARDEEEEIDEQEEFEEESGADNLISEKEEIKKEKVEKEAKEKVCPIGAVFGKDFDEYEDCDECNIRLDCKSVKEGDEPPKRRRRRE